MMVIGSFAIPGAESTEIGDKMRWSNKCVQALCSMADAAVDQGMLSRQSWTGQRTMNLSMKNTVFSTMPLPYPAWCRHLLSPLNQCHSSLYRASWLAKDSHKAIAEDEGLRQGVTITAGFDQPPAPQGSR